MLSKRFTYGYLNSLATNDKMTYHLTVQEKVKVNELKKNFRIETPHLILKY
ncbi:hypothetical protein ABLV94_07820 [Staphylococcus sp. Mo2-7]